MLHNPSVVAESVVRCSIFCYECMFAYIVFELVFQYYLRNDLFCVRWDLKPYLSVSIDNCIDLDCFSNC